MKYWFPTLKAANIEIAIGGYHLEKVGNLGIAFYPKYNLTPFCL